MDILRKRRFFNILTISLPLFCFLLSTTTTISTSPTPTPPPPLHSFLSAANILQTRGYSLFASSIQSTFSTSTLNLSGSTIFAPPDFAFTTPPSTSLLLFHTLKPPPLSNLSFNNNNSFPTLLDNLCLVITKTTNSEISISPSSVKVRQPNLYVDPHLTIHGIDGILDPATAANCSSESDNNNTHYYQIIPKATSFLDHAIRVLKKRGFSFTATALALKRSQLLNLTAVTVFATSDRSLFMNDGFRYDFLHHVVPQRMSFFDNHKEEQKAVEFTTLAPNKSLIVEPIYNGSIAVRVDNVDAVEIYHNRWIVVFAIPITLDDINNTSTAAD